MRLDARTELIVGIAVTLTALPVLDSDAFASPKSSTFTFPSGVTLMFAGLRSRWMMVFSCAPIIASTICRAIDSASSIGTGPFAMRSASVGPSTSSRTIPLAPADSSKP